MNLLNNSKNLIKSFPKFGNNLAGFSSLARYQPKICLFKNAIFAKQNSVHQTSASYIRKSASIEAKKTKPPELIHAELEKLDKEALWTSITQDKFKSQDIFNDRAFFDSFSDKLYRAVQYDLPRLDSWTQKVREISHVVRSVLVNRHETGIGVVGEDRVVQFSDQNAEFNGQFTNHSNW
jgi:hypothetical protein